MIKISCYRLLHHDITIRALPTREIQLYCVISLPRNPVCLPTQNVQSPTTVTSPQRIRWFPPEEKHAVLAILPVQNVLELAMTSAVLVSLSSLSLAQELCSASLAAVAWIVPARHVTANVMAAPGQRTQTVLAAREIAS